MKECKERNEVLSALVKILKNQEYCEWILKKDAKDSHLVLYEHKGLYGYHVGLVEKSHSVVIEMRLHGVIEVNVDSHELLHVNGKDVNGIEHAKVLDLSDDGKRWEGDVLDNKPYGWGVLYDSENRKTYEGFRVGDVNVCYGRSYYPETQKVEYEGELCEGKRMGAGVLYDRNEEVIHEGEWVNNRPLLTRVELTDKNPVLHNRVKELIVKDYSFNGEMQETLTFSCLPELRELKIGKHCFENGKGLDFVKLKELKRVLIGNYCFTEEENAAFTMTDCEKMKELIIGFGSCCDYNGFALSSIPSLKIIEMGGDNFMESSLLLKGD